MSGILRALFGIVWLPFRIAWFPIRLYREHITAQMIVSYVLVVLVSALIVQLTAVVGGYLFIRLFYDEFTTPDLGMIDQARIVSLVLGPDVIESGQDVPANEERIQFLNERLALLVENPGEFVSQSSTSVTLDESSVTAIAFALITDETGSTLASSYDGWAPAGRPVSEAQNDLVIQLTNRVLELEGQPSGYDNPWVLETDDGSTVVSYPILTNDGELSGVVTLQSAVQNPLAGFTLSSLIGPIAITLTALLGLLVVPAVFVSVPVGIWRARAFSRRLATLATAADAMAAGDLSQRVQVRGHDELSRLSQRFNVMISSLERSDQQRRAFVANISHELRTPVSIVQGNLERLLEESQARGPATENDPVGIVAMNSAEDIQTLSMMHREVRTLSRLIDDLFTLARLEESALSVKLGPVNLGAVADEAVESLKRMAWEQRKVTIQSLIPAQFPEVRADRIRVGQIFGNLLYNALRHTPEGGLIIVDAEVRGGVAQISVTDTGIGIPPEEIERIFERFRRTTVSGSVDDGAGLGLAIVKHLVEAQEGSITVESTPGSGTVFRFTLNLTASRR